MFKSVTVTNYRGDSLELPLKWPNDAGLLVSSIDGISPGNVQINSQDYAVLDGGVYNSSRMQTRNITIEFYYGFDPHIETTRHRAYRYFPIKSKVDLRFLTDERDLVISGYVESNDTQIFSEQEKGQVSIVCPDPYFYAYSSTEFMFGQALPEFEFPFSNESLTEPLICFGDYGPKSIYTIDYQGDIDVGIMVKIHFLKKTSSIDNLTFYDVTHNKKLDIDFSVIKEKTPVKSFQQYSDIIFSSVRGQKDIYYSLFGKETSIIGAFDINTFPWMYLTPGINQFGFDLGDQYMDDVRISIEYRSGYGGV